MIDKFAKTWTHQSGVLLHERYCCSTGLGVWAWAQTQSWTCSGSAAQTTWLAGTVQSVVPLSFQATMPQLGENTQRRCPWTQLSLGTPLTCKLCSINNLAQHLPAGYTLQGMHCRHRMFLRRADLGKTEGGRSKLQGVHDALQQIQ